MARGVLGTEGVLAAKGVLGTEGVLAAKGVLGAEGVLASKGVLGTEGVLASKGVLEVEKGVLVARGVLAVRVVLGLEKGVLVAGAGVDVKDVVANGIVLFAPVLSTMLGFFFPVFCSKDIMSLILRVVDIAVCCFYVVSVNLLHSGEPDHPLFKPNRLEVRTSYLLHIGFGIQCLCLVIR